MLPDKILPAPLTKRGSVNDYLTVRSPSDVAIWLYPAHDGGKMRYMPSSMTDIVFPYDTICGATVSDHELALKV